MTAPLLVGLLDSGIADHLLPAAVAARRFEQDRDQMVQVRPAEPDRLGHGTVMAELILRQTPAARLLVAQVFDGRAVATPAAVAAALSWLIGAGARVVNMSLGLRDDREVLRDACRMAVAAGVSVVASVPAIGPTVYPAAYPGIVRVTGDGRCSGAEVAALGGDRADFGASPWPAGASGRTVAVAGASVAAARISGHLAALFAADAGMTAAQAVAALAARAAHRGPQRVPPHG